MVSLLCKLFSNLEFLGGRHEPVDLDETPKTILDVLCLSLWQVCSSVQFEVFATLAVWILLAVYIFNGMEHLVKGVSDDKELVRGLGDTKSIVDGSIEETVFSVESQDFSIIEGVGLVVVDEIFVLGGRVHNPTLFHE